MPTDVPPARRLMPRGFGAVGLLATLLGAGPAEPPVDFGRDVLPILSDHCFQCHGPDPKARKGDLRLDTEAGALRKDEPVVVPGKPEESELIARLVTHERDELMPPPKANRPLQPRQIEVLTRWVREGAKWGGHWAFQPLKSPPVPTPKGRDWSRNPVDDFVLARLEAEGLNPSPEAERERLLRRVSLDLTGLPPTPAEVDAFLADARPGAYERAVDRLLASPRYGERMVWDWLDAARYADSNGYQGDSERTMWPWRDWAVNAFNRNLPFDRFTLVQLAGDLLPNAVRDDRLATGFCRNHMINGEGGRIAEENRVDYVMDMTETTATVWLGLTFNCARCHDHKYDPFTQRDYYSLFAFFNQTPVDGSGGNPQTAPVIDVTTPDLSARLAAAEANVARAGAAVDAAEKAAGRSGEPKPAARRSRSKIEEQEKAAKDSAFAALLKALREAVDARDGVARSVPKVMVMADRPDPRPTFILTRGSYEKPGDKVEAAVPAALPAVPAGSPRNRLGLARWLVDPANPLPARVTVNREWQRFFGTGLVKTPEDFGLQGERPSHPELLDWLAAGFVADGWDLKALHRRIVTSATYRQSSRVSPALAERDPSNRLLARGPRFRLPAWQLRDQALAASGLLDTRQGGPPVRPYQPEGVWEEATFGNKRYTQDHGAALYRRSLYTFWRRIVGPTEFFDNAARQTCVVKPVRTNTPLHALTTLNDPTFVEASRALAQRAWHEGGGSDAGRIEAAFRRVLGRRPTGVEVKLLTRSLDRARAEFGRDPAAAGKLLAVGESARDATIDPVEHAALASVATVILNLDETLTKE